MAEALIARINELARKKREQGLTPEEQQERLRLHRQYIDCVLRNVDDTMAHTTILEPDGTRHKPVRRDKKVGEPQT